MSLGRFIVIEGTDGAGTTTLAGKLGEHCRNARVPVHVTAQPSGGPVGAMIRQILSHRLVVHTDFGPRAPGWGTMGLLFAADRLDHLEAEILPMLRDGVTVICDRYDLSSLAYQSATSSDDPAEVEKAVAWLRQINAHALRPDLTIVLDCPFEVAAKRRRARAKSAELYDDAEVQHRLIEAYAKAEQLVPGDKVAHLDASREADEVLADAVRLIEAI